MNRAPERGTAPDPPAYFLRTERIGFRIWTAEDLPLAIGLWGNPEVTRLIADLGRPSEEQARERLAREMANRETYGIQYWPLFRLDSGEHLGCCGLRPYQPEEGLYEIGAHIHLDRWGKGYATEALRCVIAHAFGALKVRGLFARHNPHNHGSRRLMTKVGFRYTHDELMPQTGLNHPCYLLLVEDHLGLPLPSEDAANVTSAQRVMLRAEDPASPEVQRLIEQLDAYQCALYPPESLHLSPVESLRQPEVTFLVATFEGEVVGCGAMVDHGGEYAELKRMFVLPRCRGLGIGHRILAALEARARCLGLRQVLLETGVSQPEALGLYERAGYQRRGPYGGYLEDHLTIYMEKVLE